MKKSIPYIRDDFKRRFKELARQENLEISNECPWLYNLFLDDTLLVRWQSEDLMKEMSLQEAEEDEILQFDYFIDKTGVNYEYDYLFIATIDTNEKAETIFEIYKLWFIENKSPMEMEGILETYNRRFNS